MQEPKPCSRDNDTVTVIATVSGNFPGSPVGLRHDFTLADGTIARLAITPA